MRPRHRPIPPTGPSGAVVYDGERPALAVVAERYAGFRRLRITDLPSRLLRGTRRIRRDLVVVAVCCVSGLSYAASRNGGYRSVTKVSM